MGDVAEALLVKSDRVESERDRHVSGEQPEGGAAERIGVRHDRCATGLMEKARGLAKRKNHALDVWNAAQGVR